MGFIESSLEPFTLAAAAEAGAGATIDQRVGAFKRLTLLIRVNADSTITVYLSDDGSDWFEMTSEGLDADEELLWTIEHSATWVRVKTSAAVTWTVKAQVLRG